MRGSLKLGQDVVESDVWGLDCYTRRNILDGETQKGPGACMAGSAQLPNCRHDSVLGCKGGMGHTDIWCLVCSICSDGG